MLNKCCVFQEWMFELPMQQQSVLLLAARGPDTVDKFHPSKGIIRRYRASVLKAAYLGRSMHINEINGGGSFMTLEDFGNDVEWIRLVRDFFVSGDLIPHHYRAHLMHGAEILGYKHPNELFRRRWFEFYRLMVDDLHLNMESEGQLDKRLSDWDQEHWDDLAKERMS